MGDGLFPAPPEGFEFIGDTTLDAPSPVDPFIGPTLDFGASAPVVPTTRYNREAVPYSTRWKTKQLFPFDKKRQASYLSQEGFPAHVDPHEGVMVQTGPNEQIPLDRNLSIYNLPELAREAGENWEMLLGGAYTAPLKAAALGGAEGLVRQFVQEQAMPESEGFGLEEVLDPLTMALGAGGIGAITKATRGTAAGAARQGKALYDRGVRATEGVDIREPVEALKQQIAERMFSTRGLAKEMGFKNPSFERMHQEPVESSIEYLQEFSPEFQKVVGRWFTQGKADEALGAWKKMGKSIGDFYRKTGEGIKVKVGDILKGKEFQQMDEAIKSVDTMSPVSQELSTARQSMLSPVAKRFLNKKDLARWEKGTLPYDEFTLKVSEKEMPLYNTWFQRRELDSLASWGKKKSTPDFSQTERARRGAANAYRGAIRESIENSALEPTVKAEALRKNDVFHHLSQVTEALDKAQAGSSMGIPGPGQFVAGVINTPARFALATASKASKNPVLRSMARDAAAKAGIIKGMPKPTVSGNALTDAISKAVMEGTPLGSRALASQSARTLAHKNILEDTPQSQPFIQPPEGFEFMEGNYDENSFGSDAGTGNDYLKKKDEAIKSPIGVGMGSLDLIKEEESLRLKAYRDSGGVLTIGYGHTGDVKEGDRITEAKAQSLLKKDTEKAEGSIERNVKVPLTQNQRDALISLVYNIGSGNFAKSTLLKKLNKGDFEGAANEFKNWRKAGGKVSKGLVKRRAKEAKLFMEG